MKRILFVTNFFRPEPGGLEGLFTGIARKWPADRFQVLVSFRRNGLFINQGEQERFDSGEKYSIYRLQSPNRLTRFYLPGREEGYERLIGERIDGFRPDHIVFGHLATGFETVRRAATARNIPYSLIINGTDYKNRFGLLKFRERRFIRDAEHIFTFSRFMARRIEELGFKAERIAVIPPGLEPLTKKRGGRIPESLNDRLEGRVVIAGIGPFLPRKGLDLVVEAFSRLEELRIRGHLLLIGSGPEYTYLEELVRIRELTDQVTFSGFVNPDLYAHLLARADLIVQPGREREDDVQGLGTAVMEAQAAGKPVIVGAVGGVAERIQEGESGFLCPPGDVDTLAALIQKMLRSTALRKRMGRAGRLMAKKDFDLKATVSTITNYLS